MSHESRDNVMATLAMANFLAQAQGVPKAKNGKSSEQLLLEQAVRALKSERSGAGLVSAAWEAVENNAAESPKKERRQWKHPQQ